MQSLLRDALEDPELLPYEEELSMLAESPEFVEFLQRMDPDLLGTVLILGIIFSFVICIVTIVTVARTWNRMVELRMNQRLVKDLLKQGYSVDDIERLASSGTSIGRHLHGFVQSAKHRIVRMSRSNEYANRPVPPVKQSV